MGRLRALKRRVTVGGFWAAVDNLCGFLFGYDPQNWDGDGEEEIVM